MILHDSVCQYAPWPVVLTIQSAARKKFHVADSRQVTQQTVPALMQTFTTFLQPAASDNHHDSFEISIAAHGPKSYGPPHCPTPQESKVHGMRKHHRKTGEDDLIYESLKQLDETNGYGTRPVPKLESDRTQLHNFSNPNFEISACNQMNPRLGLSKTKGALC